MITTIYMFTNKNNQKRYIGVTSGKLKNRINHHKNNHRNQKFLGYNTHFYKALRKYGFENFDIDILYQSKEKEHTRKVMESYFIKEYNSKDNGYNSTDGGEGFNGYKMPKKLRTQISKRQKGVNNSFAGKTHSTETRNIISNNNIKRLSMNWKITSPTGDSFQTNRLKDFAEKNNLKYYSLIAVSKNRMKNYKGWTCFKCEP